VRPISYGVSHRAFKHLGDMSDGHVVNLDDF